MVAIGSSLGCRFTCVSVCQDVVPFRGLSGAMKGFGVRYDLGSESETEGR